MPRIPDGILESVIYVYPSVVDAQNGESTGGTGFLVAVECQRYNGVPATIYAVTNSHVIREGQSPIVRLNTHNNRTEVLRLDTSTWMHHPEGDDVAICQLELSSIHKYRAIPWTELIAAESIDEWDIGPGDDVFFVGRFMRHDGKQQNLPTARFGNISMLPLEPILHGRGHEVEAFRVEARSLSGIVARRCG